jgi:hypothetical protein
MSGRMDRILAALGLGGRKAEADVSYDPMENDTSRGAPAAARTEQGSTTRTSDRDAAPESGPGKDA